MPADPLPPTEALVISQILCSMVWTSTTPVRATASLTVMPKTRRQNRYRSQQRRCANARRDPGGVINVNEQEYTRINEELSLDLQQPKKRKKDFAPANFP